MDEIQLRDAAAAWRLRHWITERLSGQCKVLSLGADCQCPLCDLQRLYDALRWYQTEAKAIETNLKGQHDMALLATISVLSLDAGKHADDVLGPIVPTC